MLTIAVAAVVPADIDSVTEAIVGVDVDGVEWVTGEVALVELVITEVVAVAVSLAAPARAKDKSSIGTLIEWVDVPAL